MPANYYPNKTEDELSTLLTALQNRATQGHVYMTGGAGVQNVRSFQNSGPVSVEIKRVLYSLHLLSPGGYDNPYAARIRRTRANYTLS